MKDYWYLKIRALLQELRVARGAAFLFVPQHLSFADMCRAIYYEYADHAQADAIFITQILKELASHGLVPQRCMTHFRYHLDTITFHDVYLNTTDGGRFCRGTSSNFAEACAKAVGEVFERTSLRYNFDTKTRVATSVELSLEKVSYLSPFDFAQPTVLQKQTFPNSDVKETDEFSWVSALNIRTGVQLLIPAQTVFYNNFVEFPNEKKILLQSTHGAGASYSRLGAERSALYEITHRHFFLSDWYAGISPDKITPESIPSDTRLGAVIADLQKVGFTVHLLNYSKKAGLPTVVCVLERYGGWTMGASTSNTMLGAIERAVSESLATYLWQVQTTEKGGNFVTMASVQEARHDFTDTENADAYDRVMLYSSGFFVSGLDFCKLFLSGVAYPYSTELDVPQDFDSRSYAINTFGDVFLYEVTNDVLKAYNYHAVRAVIPKSYPFSVNEIYSRPVLNSKDPRNSQLTPFP